MTTENSRAADEARIREIIEERVRAIRAKDVDALMSAHAADVLMFDVLDPLRYVGSEAVRERAGQWLSWYQGPVGYEVRELSVTAGDARPVSSSRRTTAAVSVVNGETAHRKEPMSGRRAVSLRRRCVWCQVMS